MKILIVVFIICASTLEAKRRLVIWSIDGFSAAYLSHEKITKNPVWARLLNRGKVYAPVQTTLPAVTFPAHTSMMTGVDPARHGITANQPIDPFDESRRGWTWFAQDIREEPLWETMHKRGFKVANIQWPVTFGGSASKHIDFNIPQYDRGSGAEEIKLMRAISSVDLHQDIQHATGIAITEQSTDFDRLKVATYIWQKKGPDLMLLYNPGLDAIEHIHGQFSHQAFEHLDQLARGIDTFGSHAVAKDVGVLIVSDHGFTTLKGRCFPNVILKDLNLIDTTKKTWNFYFETSGGVARLIASDPNLPFPRKEFDLRLTSACPNIDLVDKTHPLFTRFAREYSATSGYFLAANARVSISNALIDRPFNPDLAGFSHGFLPEQAEMQTLAIFFTNGPAQLPPIGHVKDIRAFALGWLGQSGRQ